MDSEETSAGLRRRRQLREEHLERRLQDARCHDRGGGVVLYGREQEKAVLLDAYRRMSCENAVNGKTTSGSNRELQHESNNLQKNPLRQSSSSDFVLIHGAAGMGKSALARGFLNDNLDDNGYYIVTVPLDTCRLHPEQPHAAFCTAWTDFARRIVVNPDELRHFRQAVQQQGNISRQALLNVIPALSIFFTANDTSIEPASIAATEETPSFTNSEPSSIELSDEFSTTVDQVAKNKPMLNLDGIKGTKTTATTSTTMTGCFREAQCQFMRAIAKAEKPFVIVFDDLHWANETSLTVLQSLVEDAALQERTLFVGTCRDDEASSFDSIRQTLSEFRVQLTTIKLTSLDRDSVVELIASVLQVDTKRASQLESIMSNDIRSNLAWTWEFLRELHRRQLLYFDSISDEWCWNVNDLGPLELTGSKIIQARIQALPTKYQEYLIMAACLGPTLDTVMLQRLFSCSDETFACFLKKAKASELICYHDSRAAWCFAHDVIQAVIIDGMSTRERSEHHYRIGRKLWKMYDMKEIQHFIFLVVGQLSLAVDCMTDEREKCAVAKLCLCAGVRAVRLSQFQASLRYLEQGIALLGPDPWRQDYDTALDLFSAAAEVANSLGYSDRVHDLAGAVLRNAHCFRDKLRAEAARVHSLGSGGRFDEAIQLAFEVLAKLGEPIPLNTSRLRMSLEFAILRRRLRQKSSEALLRLPRMVDTDKLAAMHMLNLVFFYALLANDELVPVLSFRMVRITLDHGICAVSCVALVLFAGVLCNYGNDVVEGDRISKVCFDLYEQFETKVWLARLSIIHYYFVHGWLRPFEESCGPLNHAHQVGIESGDVEFALGCKLVACYNLSEIARLPDLANAMSDVSAQMEKSRQPALIGLTLSMGQMMQNLMGNCEHDPWILKGELLDEAGLRQVKSMKITYAWHRVHLAILNFVFGRISEAAAHIRACQWLANRIYGPIAGSLVFFLCGLAEVADARLHNRRRAPFTERCSKHLLRSAENGDLLNFVGKHYLLEAELAALAGKDVAAFRLYVTAIATLQRGKSTLQTAIACERTARFLLERHDYDKAMPYFREALDWYKEWGAAAKVDHLANEIRSLDSVDFK